MQSKISLSKKYIASPLNYTGGKLKLLPQILPLFPKKIETFVDLFCGGCNVGVNVNAEKIFCNDSNEKLIEFFNYLKNTDYKAFFRQISKVIEDFHLSNTAEKIMLTIIKIIRTMDKPLPKCQLLVCVNSCSMTLPINRILLPPRRLLITKVVKAGTNTMVIPLIIPGILSGKVIF